MFCIKCGKNAIIGNFCKQCFLARERLFRIKNFRIMRCSDCGHFYDKGLRIVLDEAVRKRIDAGHTIKKIKFSYRQSGNRIFANIKCDGLIRSFAKTENELIEIIVDSRKCDNCVKLSGNYYEAVVQIRGHNKNEIVDAIIRSSALVHIKDISGGYDVRFVNRHDAEKFARNYRDVKKTFKLVGEKGGKKIYRVYYSIR